MLINTLIVTMSRSCPFERDWHLTPARLQTTFLFQCWCNVSIRDGKEPSLLGFGSVRVLGLPRFGSVRVLVKYLKTGFGFYSGSVTTRYTRVRFGSVQNVSFLHCKIASTKEENVCFALLNRIMYWNNVLSTLLQNSPLILHKSCLPVHATHITSNVTLNYQLEPVSYTHLTLPTKRIV